MKYYVVGELEIVDPGWIPEYVKNVTKLVEKSGGRYLARTSKIDTIEGEPNDRGVFIIIEWPSKEAAEAFYHSEEYRPYRESRIAGARNKFRLVAGEDVAKTAQM